MSFFLRGVGVPCHRPPPPKSVVQSPSMFLGKVGLFSAPVQGFRASAKRPQALATEDPDNAQAMDRLSNRRVSRDPKSPSPSP